MRRKSDGATHGATEQTGEESTTEDNHRFGALEDEDVEEEPTLVQGRRCQDTRRRISERRQME